MNISPVCQSAGDHHFDALDAVHGGFLAELLPQDILQGPRIVGPAPQEHVLLDGVVQGLHVLD